MGYAVRNDGVYGVRTVDSPDDCLQNEVFSENFVAHVKTEREAFSSLRASRDARLAATDKYMLPDYPITADALSLVKAYRTVLRDLPDQPGAPWDGGGIETPWPELPKT